MLLGQVDRKAVHVKNVKQASTKTPSELATVLLVSLIHIPTQNRRNVHNVLRTRIHRARITVSRAVCVMLAINEKAMFVIHVRLEHTNRVPETQCAMHVLPIHIKTSRPKLHAKRAVQTVHLLLGLLPNRRVFVTQDIC